MLEALIALAGNTVVAAATTDSWEAARRKFAQLLAGGDPHRATLAERQLDETRQQLDSLTGQELQIARRELGKVWQMRMADLLEEDPDVEADLRALVEEIRAQLPAGVVSAADDAVAAGGDVNISADRGGLASGVIHEDVAPLGPTQPGPADSRADRWIHERQAQEEAERQARQEAELRELRDSEWREHERRKDAEPAATEATSGRRTRGLDFGLLGSDEADNRDKSAPSEQAAKQPDRRFFVAEFEDHPTEQPLEKGEQYTIAFSVGAPSAVAIAQTEFPDDLLAEAYKDSEVLEHTVQLNSDDFEILGESTRPLRVPRTGRSRGKARFDIAPRRNGRCQLVASVHYQGNFVHQMEVTIPVGSGWKEPVEVSTRGRPPDSAAALEPRDISIILEPATPRGFSCTALGSVTGRTVLPITATELDAVVQRARGAMMEVIGWPSVGEKVFQTRIDIPGDAQNMALKTLARAGARLFQHLFLHPAAGTDAKRTGEWLRENAMDPGLRLTVQIVADQAPLPWTMLYLGDASEGAELNWNYFLGMQHIVEQLPLQQSLSTRDNRIPSRPELAISINLNSSIDNPAKGITLVAGHQKHWGEMAAARAGLTLVSRSTRSEVVRALADATTGDQVVYFYCHATASAQGSQDPDTAEIIMGTNDRAVLADLNLDAPTSVQLAGNPLVFLNACESADLSPLFYNGFVPYFMAKGARGLIGTECKTPALFAVEWANSFFDRFLDGAAVGETVLQLRQEFLREHGNPLGLIYAVHCDADTRIAPALAPAEME
jgi:hypothetical protein